MNMSIENAEAEIARLRDRVKELETILQSAAAHEVTKDITTPSQGRLPRNDPESLSSFLRTAVEQKDILESVLESVDVGVIVSNMQGEMMLFNAAAQRIVGIGPVTGTDNWSPRYGCYRPNGIDSFPTNELPLARALRGESVRDTPIFIRNDDVPEGTLVSASANPIRDPHGTLTGGVVIFRDITKEKIAQQTLELSEERFRAFMENLPAITFIKNNAGQYIYGNHAFFAYHATDVSKLENGFITDFDLTQKECAEMIQGNDARVLAGETPLHVREHLINFDGRTTWFSVYKFRLPGPSGEVLLGGIADDITESRKYAERLEADEKLLRKMIDLQERERLLVAHDLHDGFVQDVVGAKMLTEALKEQLTGRTDLVLDNHFIEISEALGRAIADARRLISELRPLVIDEEGVVEAIRYLISEKRYAESMKITFTPQMGPLRLDPLLEGNIFRIVQEALNNSERHGEAGTVAINLGIYGEMIELSIADDGKGFDLEQVPSGRFGLRGMHERARLFGGKLQIASSPGKGTRIDAQLPVKASSEQSTDAAI